MQSLNLSLKNLLPASVRLCTQMRPCSFSFLFFPLCLSASRYLVRFAWSTLPLSRANICRYTLKRSETKRRRDTLAKFGISTNLSSTNIRLLVCRERLCSSRFSSLLRPLRVLSATFTTSSCRIFASLISAFPCRYRLPCQTSHERGPE